LTTSAKVGIGGGGWRVFLHGYVDSLLLEWLDSCQQLSTFVFASLSAQKGVYMARKTNGGAFDGIDADLVSTSFLSLFSYLQDEASILLQAHAAPSSSKARLLLASLEMSIALCNTWIRSRSSRIDKDGKLILQQKRQEARFLYAELSMAIQEQESAPLWTSVRLPKITDRSLAEQWLHEGLISSLEEVYVHLSPGQEKEIDKLVKSREFPEGYQPANLWTLAKPPK
jgi:hypothetical protein